MIDTLIVLIPALPLAAFLLLVVFGRALKAKSHLPVALAFAGSCVLSLLLLFQVQNALPEGNSEASNAAKTDGAKSTGKIGYEHTYTLWTWASVADAYTPDPKTTPTAVPAPSPQPSPIGRGSQATPDTQTPATQTPQTVPFTIDITLRADPLTVFMLCMVTFISTLVVIYASGYMHGDPGYPRFFTYVALFVFSMTMLVSVSNFLLLYVFWEAVGLCSYLLVGFWYQKPSAVAAGKKAFMVNRVGDFGFAIGLFLIWTTYGTLNYHDTTVTNPDGSTQVVAGVLGQTRLAAASEPSPSGRGQGEGAVAATTSNSIAANSSTSTVSTAPAATAVATNTTGTNPLSPALSPGEREKTAYATGGVSVAICLLLMAGACGKSAQFPLHVWLPDAMEGPTPVSALIHAATMVTAGVYMVARCTPLFMASAGVAWFTIGGAPVDAQMVVAAIGGFTAIMAGTIAITQTDLKRVLAYSTISQLGYMFLSLGTGSLAGIIAGMFHLFTHAFFKALLFLGSGSVMHAMGGVIDMRRIGGLRKLMPITCITFLIGCFALAGLFPFAGFWSKDEILGAVHHRAMEAEGLAHNWYNVLYWVGMITAGMTAFYTFRGFFLTFFGPERIPPEAGHHAHESPPAMTMPLVILSLFALGIGAYYGLTHGILNFLRQTPSLAYGVVQKTAEEPVFHWSVALASTAIVLVGIGLAMFMYLGDRNAANFWAKALRPLYELSYGKFFIDQIYQAVFVWPLRVLATISYWFDRYVIDALVNFVGAFPAACGAVLRTLQNGMVQFYALAMMLGLVVLIVALIFVPWPW